MAINYTVKNMRISDFNPYSKFYVAHAFCGRMPNYSNSTRIHNGMLKSSNVLDIKKIEISRRIMGKVVICTSASFGSSIAARREREC